MLSRLGVFTRIESRCYIATHRVFVNDRDEITKKTEVADIARFGFRNHRIWRALLLAEMRAMLQERGVEIVFDSKFNGIVTEHPDDGVTFLINAVPVQASLLVGADGIYSSVRTYLAPDVVPQYTGLVGVLCHIPRASVAWPSPDYAKNATIQGSPGAIFFIPEDPGAETIMTGVQIAHPQPTRAGLETLQSDKAQLVDFYRRGYNAWGPTARSLIDAVAARADACYIWPYMRLPVLERWASVHARVLLVGDAAHALPPSSGQGVNQALEDVWALTLLLTAPAARRRGPSLGPALEFWQAMRQKRIDAVDDWATNVNNVSRLPEAERTRLSDEGKLKTEGVDDMGWLYTPTLEGDVEKWLAGD